FDFKSTPSLVKNIVAKTLQYLDNLIFPSDLRYDIRSELREGKFPEKLMFLDYKFFYIDGERHISYIYAMTLVDGKMTDRFAGIAKDYVYFDISYDRAVSKGWQMDIYPTQDDMVSSFIQFVNRNQDAV